MCNENNSMPCRSCKHYVEGDIINGEATSFVVDVSCLRGMDMSTVKDLDMYGVNDQKVGEAVCNMYWHVGFQW